MRNLLKLLLKALHFIAEILGHREMEIRSSSSYSKWVIDTKPYSHLLTPKSDLKKQTSFFNNYHDRYTSMQTLG